MSIIKIDVTNDNYETVLHALEAAGESLEKNVRYIIFKVGDITRTYKPEVSYLYHCNGTNNQIFLDLGLNAMQFCNKIYEKPSGCGNFPETSSSKDLIAVTRALFDRCTGKDPFKLQVLEMSDLDGNAFLGSLEEDIHKHPVISHDLDKLFDGGAVEPAIEPIENHGIREQVNHIVRPVRVDPFEDLAF